MSRPTITPAKIIELIAAAEAKRADTKAIDKYLDGDQPKPDDLSMERVTDRMVAGVYFSPEQSRPYELLLAMTEDERRQTMALMWIGRGDGGPEDFDAAYAHAGDIPDNERAGYIASKAPLAKYLRAGMAKAGL